MFFSFNIYGSLFYQIGETSISYGYKSWIDNNSGNFGAINTLNVYEQYFFSFYFALSILSSTMGFGDFVIYFL